MKCPHCGSDDVLPFEDESSHKSETSFSTVLIVAVVIVLGYITLIVTSYIFYQLAIMGALILIAWQINRYKGTKRKRHDRSAIDYMCVDCGKFFKHTYSHKKENEGDVGNRVE